MMIFKQIFWIILSSQYWTHVSGKNFDLLPVEAMCAAKCFSKFENSIADTNIGIHLKLNPQDVHDYCENENRSCQLCLDFCLDEESSLSCDKRCSNILAARNTSTMIPSENNVKKEWFTQQTCAQICNENHANLLKYYNLRYTTVSKELSCPSKDSWVNNCQVKCETDNDCMGIGVKCCVDNISCKAKESLNHYSPQPNLYYNDAQDIRGSSSNTTIGTCMPAVVKSESYTPPVPKQPKIKTLIRASNAEFIENKKKALEIVAELSWSQYYQQLTEMDRRKIGGPVVFLMQVRQFVDKDEMLEKKPHLLTQDVVMDQLFSTWYNLKWTSLLMAELQDLGEGTWFQFRVQSYNEFGSGGWSRPTKPYRVKNPKINVSGPRNLMEVKTHVHENLVDVSLTWNLLNDNTYDMQKMYWCEYHNSRCSWHTSDWKLSKNDRKYTITNLKPSTTYRVQVTSLLNVNNQTFESKPTELFLKTTSVNTATESLFHNRRKEGDDVCNCDMDKEVMSFSDNSNLIQVYPFWDGDKLKARIKIDFEKIYPSKATHNSLYTLNWIPHACIENSQSEDYWKSFESHSRTYYETKSPRLDINSLKSYILPNLKFQCHYKIILQSTLFNKFNRNKYQSCFCTPSCQKVKLVSGNRPKDCFVVDNQVPKRPENIAYLIKPAKRQEITKSSWNKYQLQNDQPKELYEAVVSWKYPVPVLPQTDVVKPEGFRIIYGPRLYEPIGAAYEYGMKPKIDNDRSITRVLGPESNHITLRDLERNTVYVVQLQTIGKKVDSPVQSINFLTPTKEINSKSTKTLPYYYQFSSSTTPRTNPFIPSVLISLILVLIER